MRTRKYQVAAWAAFAATIFVTVSPIEMRPGDILSVDFDRALAFGLLSSMFMVAYPRHALLVGSFVVLSAGFIELLQALSPSRHARLDDAIIKGAGALVGALLAYGYNALRVVRYRRRAMRHHDIRTASASYGDDMQQFSIKSKMIEAVYFNPKDGKLRVRMRDGEEKLFAGVEEGDVASLVTAASPGKYYAEKIRKKYPRLAA